MTDGTASLPPKLLPAQPPSGHAPSLEDDSVRIAEDGQFWLTEDGLLFAEVLDILNPLHHTPGISTIYSAITGDEIGAEPRFVGGMLFGGPIGALAARITALFEEASGGDLVTHIAEIVDDFTGGSDPEAAAIAAAQHIGQNTGRNAPPTAAETSAAHLPKDANIFPVLPERTAVPQGMAIPFGGTALGRREQESEVRRPRERQRRAKDGRTPPCCRRATPRPNGTPSK